MTFFICELLETFLQIFLVVYLTILFLCSLFVVGRWCAVLSYSAKMRKRFHLWFDWVSETGIFWKVLYHTSIYVENFALVQGKWFDIHCFLDKGGCNRVTSDEEFVEILTINKRGKSSNVHVDCTKTSQ